MDNNYNNFDGSNNQPNSNGYGQPDQQSTNAYGQPQAAQQDTNMYGQPQAAQQSTNMYGQPQTGQQQYTNAYGQSQQQSYTNAFNQATQQNTQQGATAFDQRQNATSVNYAQGYNQAGSSSGGMGFAIAALVLGIVSIVACCLWFVGLTVGVLAIVFGILGLNQYKDYATAKNMSIAGLACGAAGTVLSLISLLINLS